MSSNPPAPLSGGDARTQLAEVLFAAKQAYDGDFYVVAWEDNYARDKWYALADALLPVVQRIADERAAEALEQAMREDRTTVEKLHPVERLTCFLVKGEDLLARAASLRAGESA